MNILSIQSHVSYGYVGNKAATFPLQSLGFDVWAVNTVQFSNHTGYGAWKGEIFSAEHIAEVIEGLKARGLASQCDAILSGYIGDKAIGTVVMNTVRDFKKSNPKLIYLCDPVMGDPDGKGCFVKPDILPFFREESLQNADIITPNQYEAEILYEKNFSSIHDFKKAAQHFHEKGVKLVIITSSIFPELLNRSCVFLSTGKDYWLATAPRFTFPAPVGGTGDLFSALYLGNYLKTEDPVFALEQALTSTFLVMQSTFQRQKRELQIIGNFYHAQKLSDIHIKKLI